MGTLYIVATPIGNREDITLRALRVLREVAIIAAEDTRHTGQLLAHYQIAARFLSLHEHNEHARASAIIARLDAGEDVALVSDAGTPLIADPGAYLVSVVRAAGHRVEPVPGASALLSAVVASGIAPGPFTFVGFLPPKHNARGIALEGLRDLRHPIVLYEAPHRLAAMLADALVVFGDRRCTLCRELTKLHEEVTETTLADACEALTVKPARGEYVVIIDEAMRERPSFDEDAVIDLIRTLLASGASPAAAAKEVAAQTGTERAICYTLAISVQKGSENAGSRPTMHHVGH